MTRIRHLGAVAALLCFGGVGIAGASGAGHAGERVPTRPDVYLSVAPAPQPTALPTPLPTPVPTPLPANTL